MTFETKYRDWSNGQQHNDGNMYLTVQNNDRSIYSNCKRQSRIFKFLPVLECLEPQNVNDNELDNGFSTSQNNTTGQ